MAEHWIDRPDCRLYVLERGSGPAVIALHGGLADHAAALPLASGLPDRYRVVTPDIRGAGKSHYAADLSFDQLTEDLGATMDELGIAAAILVGVSTGTGVAVHFALNCPARVAGLVLVRPIYAGEDSGYMASQAAALGGMDAVASRAATEGVAALEPLYAGLPPGIRDKAMAMAQGFDGPSVAATSRFVAGGAQPFRSADELGSLTMPTLIVRGNDPMHPAEISDLYVAKVPTADVAEVPDDEVAETIASFIGRPHRT